MSRRLGTADAVFVGLGAMIGAGIFTAVAPAAGAAGRGVLLGLVIFYRPVRAGVEVVRVLNAGRDIPSLF